jgi:hypothetical protein
MELDTRDVTLPLAAGEATFYQASLRVFPACGGLLAPNGTRCYAAGACAP